MKYKGKPSGILIIINIYVIVEVYYFIHIFYFYLIPIGHMTWTNTPQASNALISTR